nr:PREDICTED: uncharacterized protein LOC106705992 [Latimeria chalumnae]|eukprot:XP_014351752.1 PREDICTED: uncharacterized protein LOC106705992 [Latimeria chalumnae]
MADVVPMRKALVEIPIPQPKISGHFRRSCQDPATNARTPANNLRSNAVVNNGPSFCSITPDREPLEDGFELPFVNGRKFERQRLSFHVLSLTSNCKKDQDYEDLIGVLEPSVKRKRLSQKRDATLEIWLGTKSPAQLVELIKNLILNKRPEQEVSEHSQINAGLR